MYRVECSFVLDLLGIDDHFLESDDRGEGENTVVVVLDRERGFLSCVSRDHGRDDADMLAFFRSMG